VSGPAFARWASAHLGRLVEPEQIACDADAGDATALACLDQLADRVARGLAVVVDVLDPEVIVLGGGLSNISALFPRIRDRLGGYVFSDHVATLIKPNHFGDSSGVRGAAWLWEDAAPP
jgi:fructokinase